MQMLNIPFSMENGNTYQIKATDGEVHTIFNYTCVLIKRGFDVPHL